MAITVALIVATIKGSLVALFFMHLSNERKLIYYALALTVVFFTFMMFVPLLDELRQDSRHDRRNVVVMPCL